MNAEHELKLTTKRLTLMPLSNEEIQDLINKTADEELKQAYTEMLDGAKKDPEHRIWYAPWGMYLRRKKTFVGDLCFKGPVRDDAVEIGYGVLPEYQNQGYTTEAAEALIDWALDQKDVYFAEAEAEPSNAPSLRVLEKLKFTEYGIGEEGPRFVREKPKPAYTGICMSFGLCLGMSIGMLLFDNLVIGMCCGMSVGVGIGVYLDARSKKAMEEARKRRAERLGKEAEK